MSGEKLNVKGEYLEVPIDALAPNSWNPNRQPDFIFEKEKNSIDQFGFIDPILVRVVNGNYQIIDGEHRLKGAIANGMKTISIINLGEVPDATAQQLTIIMNDTRGHSDEKLLSKLVLEIKNQVGLEEVVKNLPYSDIKIEDLLAKAQIDMDQVDAGQNHSQPATCTLNQVLEYKVSEEIAATFRDAVQKVKLKMGQPEDADPAEAIQAIAQIIHQIDLDVYLR